MRTTLTLDDDVAALVEHERSRTGESFKQAVNRLLRRGAAEGPSRSAPPLPERPGGPLVDISDTSAVLAALDDQRIIERHLL